MRLGNKLALVLGSAGTVIITFGGVLATCVSTGILAAWNMGSNCDAWTGSVSVGIYMLAGISLLATSALLALNAWNPKPAKA